MSIKTDEYLSQPVVQEYLKKLEGIDIPRYWEVQDYPIIEIFCGKQRKIMRHYVRKVRNFPLKNINASVDRLKRVGAPRTMKISLGELSPLLWCSVTSAEVLMEEKKTDYPFFAHYLLGGVVASQIANDYNNQTLELGYLWYLLRKQKRCLFSAEKRDGVIEKIDPYDCQDIIEYGLASLMFKRYQANPVAVSGDIQRLVTDKGSIEQMLSKYSVSFQSSEMVSVLEEQAKMLILNKPTN